MSELSYFFDGSDKSYGSGSFASMFETMLTDGVVKGFGNELHASFGANGTIIIDTGRAWINGRYYENTASLSLTIPTADASNPRIDRVVLRLNMTNRNISLGIKSGTPAADPPYPPMQKDSTVFEIPICRYRVNAGATLPTNLVDERSFVNAVNIAQNQSNKNYLINGNFVINQRVFGGGALAAGKYGHDRWKADATGANYTVSSGVVTLTSGTLVQVIETPWLAGETVTVSVDSPTKNLAVNVEGVTGTIYAGSGRRGVTLTIPSSSTGNVTLKLSGTSASFSNVQLEKGSVITDFEYRPIAQERVLCQRYYENSYFDGVAPGTATTSGSVTTFIQTAYWPVCPTVLFQTIKAKEPSVTLFCPNTFSDAGYSEYDISDTFVANKPLSARDVSTKSFGVINASGNSTPGYIMRFHYVAESEF